MLDNDTVPGGSGVVRLVVVDPGPVHGMAEVIGGTVVYRPAPGFVGTETFVYEVCTDAGCAEAEVTVRVGLLCDLAGATAEVFGLDPATAGAGDGAVLSVRLRVDRLDSTCGVFVLPVTFDDMPFGTVTVGMLGPVSMPGVVGVLAADAQPADRRVLEDAILEGSVEVVVPEQAAEGTHVVRLWAGDPLQIIAETSMRVEPVPPTTAPSTTTTQPQLTVGMPVGVVAGGGLLVLAAGGVGVLLLGRRRVYAEPCPEPRRSLLRAQKAAEAAAADAEAAEERASEADAVVGEAEAALVACEEEARRAGLVPAGLVLGGGGGEVEVPVSAGFYLEDHPNRYATERAELQGWFGLHRTESVRGVVIHSGGVVPATVSTAAEAAQELATMRRPFSVHAIVDDMGVTVLLRDERVGRHVAAADQASLGVLWLPGADEKRSVAILGAWCAAKAVVHGFPLRRVGFEEWVQGDGGLIGAGDFPDMSGIDHRPLDWDGLLGVARADDGMPAAVPMGVLGLGDRCVEEEQARDQARSVADEARVAAVEARAAADRAAGEAEAAKRELDDCECRHPVIAAPVNAATQERPDDADPSRWFLLAHENKYGGMRANGKHGWYYPNRQQVITGIVVHTAESKTGPGVAAYLSKVRRAASAHVVVDAAGPVDLLPDSMVAFHAKGGNSRGLGLEIAYKASNWGKDPEYEERLYRNAAAWCALKALQYGIPIQRVSPAQWREGVAGFISHAELDPARRTDPGDRFDWDHFFEFINRYISGGIETPTSTDTMT